MNSLLLKKVQKYLFVITILITIGFLYYPKYLPMVDVPQHTALVATMDDLLKGKSPWADMLWINWDTPYIATYLIWLLLYQIMPILWATKTIIVLIFLLYVYAIILLRKTFEADKMLDWVGLTCFFGFSFQWGFVPFMLGTTVGLLFLSYNKRYLDNPNNRDWILILLTGTIAYFSHLLAFAFFCMTAYAYFLFSSFIKFSWKQKIIFTIPYLFFALLLLHYCTTPDPVPSNWYVLDKTQLPSYSNNFTITKIWNKIVEITCMPWNMFFLSSESQLLLYSIWFIPVLLGLKTSSKKNYYIPLLCLLGFWFLVPHFLANSAYVYQRFANLIPIFYFLLWNSEKSIIIDTTINKKTKAYLVIIARILFVSIIIAMMHKVYNNNILFSKSKDIQDFEIIAEQITPKKRILYMVRQDNTFDSNNLTSGYEHYYFAQYYNALKQGWVDRSFASEHAIPVRFNKENTYSLDFKKYLAPSKKVFQEKLLDCDKYDFLIIRPYRNHFLSQIVNKQTISNWLIENEKCSNMKLLKETNSLLLFGKH